MKKTISIIISLVLLFSFMIPAFAQKDGLAYVIDNADILTSKEEDYLTEHFKALEKENKCSFIVATFDEIDNDIESFTDDFYDEGGYGYGENHTGIIMLLDMSEREWWISTCGDIIYGIQPYIEDIGDAFVDGLNGHGDYCNGFLNFADTAVGFLDEEPEFSTDKSLYLIDECGVLSDKEKSDIAERLINNSFNERIAFIVVFSLRNDYTIDDFKGKTGFDRTIVEIINPETKTVWSVMDCDWYPDPILGIGAVINDGIKETSFYETLVKFTDLIADIEEYYPDIHDGQTSDDYEYDYDYDFDNHYGTDYKKLIICSLVIGFVLALIVVLIMAGKNKTVRFQRDANQYRKSGSFTLKTSQDRFLYRTVSKTKISDDDSNHHSGSSGGFSSGGIHTSSGGVSHGGGGGHF